MDERQQTAAERIYHLIPFWEWDHSMTEKELIDSIYNDISADPVSTITYLLDMIDDLNA